MFERCVPFGTAVMACATDALSGKAGPPESSALVGSSSFFSPFESPFADSLLSSSDFVPRADLSSSPEAPLVDSSSGGFEASAASGVDPPQPTRNKVVATQNPVFVRLVMAGEYA